MKQLVSMADRSFSAGEVEKFCYCPMSWWLSRSDNTTQGENTSAGTLAHEKLSADLANLSGKQAESVLYSRMIMYYAVIATALAAIGISLVNFDQKLMISRILLLVAVVWLLLSLSILYLTRTEVYSRKRLTERLILFLATLSMVLSIMSVTILQVNTLLAEILETASLIWLIGASSFLYLDLRAEEKASRLERSMNISGKIVYIGDDSHPVLVSENRSISGRPDFIVESDGMLMPVEFKSGRVPSGPLFSHVIQISAYCKLVEDNYGKRPDFGFIYYGTKRFAVDYDDEVEKLLMTKVSEMRSAEDAGNAHRNHNRPGKCVNCSRRNICPERLA